MAKTRQGAFEKTYHHIDAPTYQDEDYWKEHKKRILINPYDKYNDYDAVDASHRTTELVYLYTNPWTWKRKLDGENIRIYWNGEQALWNGKSNKFTCTKKFQDYMNNTFIEEIFEEKFGRDKEVYIYGEHMGPKVQGNELGLDEDEVVIFDVEIDGMFVCKESIEQIAGYFGVKSVYDYMPKEKLLPKEVLAEWGDFLRKEITLDDLINLVAKGYLSNWEGIVCTPACNIKDHNGNRIIVKIKNKDYNKEWKRK